MWSRRAALALPAALAGCGFRPLYGPPGSSGTYGAVAPELAAVRIGPTFDRTGQLLRRSLQRRMEGIAPGTPAKYELDVSLTFSSEVLGYRIDGTISRVRTTLSGIWVLRTLAVPPVEIARSSVPYRMIDDYDVPDLRFLAADSARDAMEARLMEGMASAVTEQVAIALRQYQAPKPA